MIKTCKGCNKKFDTDKREQFYCTIRCRDDNRNKRLRIAYAKKPKPMGVMKPCFYCGKSFRSTRARKFCSGNCAWKNQSLTKRKTSKKKKSLANYNFDESKVCKKTGEKFTFKFYLSRVLGLDESKVEKMATKKDLAKWYKFFRRSTIHPIVNVPSVATAKDKRCAYCNKPTNKNRTNYERRWFCDDGCYSLFTRFKQVRGSRSWLSGGSKK